MCPHNDFRYYDLSEALTDPSKPPVTVKVIKLRICVHCNLPEIQNENAWDPIPEA